MIKKWEVMKQYQPLYGAQIPIDIEWEPFAVTPTEDGVWIWLRKEEK